MSRVFTIGARGAGISAIPPKRGATPRSMPVQEANDDDIDDDPRDRAPPPPGMGKLVDKLA